MSPFLCSFSGLPFHGLSVCLVDRSGVAGGCFFAHLASEKTRPGRSKGFPRPERNTAVAIESAFCGVGVLVMRRSSWTPSIVPSGDDQNIYIVWMISGAGPGPIAKPTSSASTSKRSSWTCSKGNIKTRFGWSVSPRKNGHRTSPTVAHELRRRCDPQQRGVRCYLQDFVDLYEGRYHNIQLPLPMRLGVSPAVPAQEAGGDRDQSAFPTLPL